jgi:hypothetical protein
MDIKTKYKWVIIALGAFIVLLPVFIYLHTSGNLSFSNSLDESLSNETNQNSENIKNTTANEPTDKPNLDDIEQGCPRRDCIPSIEDPVFESQQNADSWLNDDDLVFGLELNNVKRVYPQRILNWHEIVNDNLGGRNVAVTFCPLCGSAVTFDRAVNGQVVEFGVSGKLYNSNLIMYDRTEESYWQQETGVAISGPAGDRNEKLEFIPMSTVTWGDWKEIHNESQVLSRDTGFTRDYARYPYGTYEEDGEIYFGIQNSDDRLPVKEPGFGFTIEDNYKFYREKDIKSLGIINDTIGEFDVTVRYNSGVVTLIKDNQESKEIIPIRTFWFAFAAFHPDTEIYKAE